MKREQQRARKLERMQFSFENWKAAHAEPQVEPKAQADVVKELEQSGFEFDRSERNSEKNGGMQEEKS